ncbi:MAG: nucleotidyltransferase family protein [Betaproteobacteria bacterium]
MRIVGILLAAGAGSRFGGDKLLARLSDGSGIGHRSASNLIAVLPEVIAVVRPGDDALAAQIATSGARVTICADAHTGMGASLAHGVHEAGAADAFVVALADMPWISDTTMREVVVRLGRGDPLVVPQYRGQRGHPVGFGLIYRAALMTLTGDTGAKAIVAVAPAGSILEVDDPGVVRDVDVRADID